jgi:chromosome segregation ATPase
MPPQQAATAPQRPRGPAGVPQRATELEAELSQLRAAMAQQKREFEEETSSFPQVLARLAHSERALGQAKTKLIAAEEAAAEVSTQLAACRARVQEAETQLQQRLDAEREARIELTTLRDALAAALDREPAFQRTENELRGELATLRAALETAEQEREEMTSLGQALAAAHQERDELLGALGGIELLAQRIARISRDPTSVVSEGAKPSQYPESDDKRATLRPVAAMPSREAPRSFRRATPEIIVDGIPLRALREG